MFPLICCKGWDFLKMSYITVLNGQLCCSSDLRIKNLMREDIKICTFNVPATKHLARKWLKISIPIKYSYIDFKQKPPKHETCPYTSLSARNTSLRSVIEKLCVGESGGRCPGFRKTWITQRMWEKSMCFGFLHLVWTFLYVNQCYCCTRVAWISQ